jgi:glycosyltransferase involved in cell wall biosynthesis
MKIAMIGQKGIPTKFGGVETHVEKLALRLGALGHEVTVYTRAWYAAPQADFAPGVRTVLTPSLHTKHLDAITHTFTSTLHAIADGAEIIHYHGVGPSLLAWIPRLFAPRVRVISTFHSIDRKHQKWGIIARLALGIGEWTACRLPHTTITISQGLRSYCFDRYFCDTHYIPNGVDVPTGASGAATPKALGLELNRYFITTGRLIRLKGIHHLIAGFLKVKAAGALRGMKLVIVGDSAYSDAYVHELKAMAAGHDEIVFAGYRQGRELEELLAYAYAAVHPSETEGLSLSLLEEMAHGKTVLASDIPGNTEALGQCGVTFRNKDAHDLAGKLAALIADPAYAAANGAASRERVRRQYAWDDIAAATDQLYAEVIAARDVVASAEAV